MVNDYDNENNIQGLAQKRIRSLDVISNEWSYISNTVACAVFRFINVCLELSVYRRNQ